MKCHYCGTEVTEKEIYCRHCGTKQMPAAQEEPVNADPETEDHSPPTTADEETSGGEAEQAESTKAGNLLPDGFIAIDMNGRTPDGSVPFFILKNQLDRMR